MDPDKAASYHAKHKPQALVIEQDGTLLLESYDGGFDANTPHALYSGTKSFWGTAAVLAEGEGLLALDTPVWHGATVRQLLNLTAGAPFGGLGSAVPPFEKAVLTPQRDAPGTKFTYGGIPLQIFGAYFTNALRPLHLSAYEYLRERVLQPAGVDVHSWRTLKDGTHPLPTGAFVSAANWARYGAYMLSRHTNFGECFRGSAANPRYGLAWWLAPPRCPDDLFYASGSGGQAMYVVPSLKTVIVRFGGGGSFNHQSFLRQLFS